MKFLAEGLISQCRRLSPSMRREWIEISAMGINLRMTDVSLHAEGVD